MLTLAAVYKGRSWTEAAGSTMGQLGYLLEGVNWRNPQATTWRPEKAGQALRRSDSPLTRGCLKTQSSWSTSLMGEVGGLGPEEVATLRAALAGAEARAALAEAILQADAYAGYNTLCARAGPPITGALCWSHARRYFYELADVEPVARRKAKSAVAVTSPMALEAVRRIDAMFDIERALNDRSAAEHLAARQEHSAPLVVDLHDCYAPSAPSFPAGPAWPCPSTTCSSAGRR